MISKLTLSFVAFLFVAMLGASPAVAQGAVAIGEPPSVPDDGLAIGWVVNAESEADARAEALEQCLRFEGASAAARALCKVKRTFVNECVAVSLDPEPGTPGFGWSVSPNRVLAENAAMAGCKTTAGSARQGFCEVQLSECDGE